MGVGVKLTASLEHWLMANYPEKLITVSFGHYEDITDDMWREYLKWCNTEDGQQYLIGGSKYHDPR